MNRRGCTTGKYCYRDRLEALFFLLRIQESGDPRHQERRAYGPCFLCGNWHLTSQTQKSAGQEESAPALKRAKPCKQRGRSKWNRKRSKYQPKGGDEDGSVKPYI